MLLLFDIDGTLLAGAHEAHREALHAALHSVYGVADPDAAGVAAAGRTDPEIARAILLRSDVTEERIAAGLDEFRAACCDQYARRCPASLAACVVPGVAELLASLAPRARLSLVTGNLEPIARLKLARAGLGRYFAPGQGAFGSDAEDRTLLPALARGRAGDDGVPYARAGTLLIGDTPRDIACAQTDGLRCVAVTTGPYGAEALAGADALARDAAELRALLERELEAPAAGA